MEEREGGGWSICPWHGASCAMGPHVFDRLYYQQLCSHYLCLLVGMHTILKYVQIYYNFLDCPVPSYHCDAPGPFLVKYKCVIKILCVCVKEEILMCRERCRPQTSCEVCIEIFICSILGSYNINKSFHYNNVLISTRAIYQQGSK